MATLLEDIDGASSWIAAALTESGYPASFDGPSLWQVDRFFDEHSRDGEAVPDGLLSEDLRSRLFAIGAYTGEVVRRALGGTWRVDDDDPEGALNVTLQLQNDLLWPVQRAVKRFRNGPEDSIGAYGASVGIEVGPRRARW